MIRRFLQQSKNVECLCWFLHYFIIPSSLLNHEIESRNVYIESFMIITCNVNIRSLYVRFLFSILSTLFLSLILIYRSMFSCSAISYAKYVCRLAPLLPNVHTYSIHPNNFCLFCFWSSNRCTRSMHKHIME